MGPCAIRGSPRLWPCSGCSRSALSTPRRSLATARVLPLIAILRGRLWTRKIAKLFSTPLSTGESLGRQDMTVHIWSTPFTRAPASRIAMPIPTICTPEFRDFSESPVHCLETWLSGMGTQALLSNHLVTSSSAFWVPVPALMIIGAGTGAVADSHATTAISRMILVPVAHLHAIELVSSSRVVWIHETPYEFRCLRPSIMDRRV